MAINNLFDVVYTAVADLNGVSVKYLPNIVACWETVVDKVEEFFLPTLVFTFLLKGGLYHRMLFLGLFFFCVCVCVGFRRFKLEFVVVATVIQCFLV